MADEKIEVLITADDKASGILKGLSGTIGSIGSKLATAVVAGATTAAVAVGAFIMEATQAAGRVQELGMVLDVLAKQAGLSQESVQAEALAVKHMGIETASAQEIVALFVQNQLDMSQASELARVAQDAAVISGKNSTETTMGLINGIVTLQTEVLRSNGITVDLAAAYDTYAASIGVVAKDLTSQQKQQAALNAVIESGTRIAGAYKAAMETAGKQMRSWPRYINDILVNAGTPFQDAFSKSAGAVSIFLKEIGKAFEAGGALAPVMEKLAGFADLLAIKFADWLGKVDFDVIGEKISGIIDSISSLFSGEGMGGGLMTALSGILPILSGIGGIFMQALLPAIIQIGTALAPIVEAILPVLVELFGSVAMTILNALLPPLLELIQTVLPPLMELITPLIQLFGKLAEALAPIVGTILGALADLVTRLMKALMPVIDKVLPILADLFITVSDAIVPLLDAILPPLIDLVMMVIDAFMPLIVAILPVVADLFKIVIMAIAPILTAILPVLIKLIEFLVIALTPVIQMILPVLTTLMDALAYALETYVIPALGNFSKWMTEHVTPAIEGIIRAIQSAIDWVRNMAASLSSITLPDWLTPGSPTPFEMGLRGIASALKDVNDIAFPSLTSVSAPFTGTGAGGRGPTGSAAGGANVQIVLNYSPAMSFATADELRDRLVPFVLEGIRRAKSDGLI